MNLKKISWTHGLTQFLTLLFSVVNTWNLFDNNGRLLYHQLAGRHVNEVFLKLSLRCISMLCKGQSVKNE